MKRSTNPDMQILFKASYWNPSSKEYETITFHESMTIEEVDSHLRKAQTVKAFVDRDEIATAEEVLNRVIERAKTLGRVLEAEKPKKTVTGKWMVYATTEAPKGFRF